MITRAMNEYPETPNIILQNRRGEKLGVIENATNLVHTVNMNSADEISFKVYKQMEGSVCRLWDDIHDFRLVYIPDYHESFEIEVSLSESTDTVKSVTGTQFQYAELSQVNLYDVQINTEDDIARDDYDEKYPTTFYRDDKDHKDASLLDRILKDKASHYEIYHVDDSLKNITRTFNFSGKDIISALNEIAEEADCLFVFGESDTPFDGKLHRTISAYDLEDYCNDCGERGMFKDKCTKCGSTNYISGYGKDTGVFISKDNIAETVNYETNSGEVKNCFKLKAGDDLMTATVRNCNPNGSDYIWYFTDQTKADMSDALSNALTQYDKDYEEIYSNKQMDISQSAVDDYNSIVEKYKDYSKNNGEQHEPISYPIKGYGAMISADYNAMDLYSYLQNTMMPGSSTVQETTAEKEAAKLTSATLSPIGVENTSVLTRVTQDNAVMSYAKVLYDFSKYSITVKSSRMVTTESWGGILTLKSYTDSKDVADTGYIAVTFNNDALTFTKQKIDKAMKSKEAYAISAPEVIKLDYDDFVSHVHNRYGLNPLKVFESCLQSAVDVLTEQGCGQDYGDDRNFHSIYEEYVKKLNYIKTEEGERQSEMDQIAQYEDSKLVGGLLAEIENQRLSVRQSLDMKTYLDKIDTGLWAELNSFRREQEYSNSNYISTNLTNSETVKNAQDFLKKATLELIKSATLQHSISGSLYDLLIMPEFDGLLDNFDVGNWIRLMVDGEVYKLRLKSYTVDYDAANIQRINATFSDVINGLGTVDDLKSIFDSAKSVAMSYNTVMRQADKGNKANTQIENFVNEGLNLTNSKIVSDDNQNVTYDEHGILLRRKDDLTDAYEPTQLKIINNGMYYTRNNWTTAEAAFGKFLYVDPSDNFAEKTGYGVIANHLVGNLILGKQVGIYNQAGSVTINESGINLSADSNSNNQNLLKINRRNDDGTVNNIVSLNKKGKLVIDGSVLVKSSSSGDTQTIDALADRVKDVSVEYAQNQSQTEAPDDGWQTTAIKQKEGYYIWLRVKTVSGDDTVTYSVPTCVTAINGQSITVTSVTFAQGDNGTTAPTQGWQTSVPTVAQGKWLWCRTTFSDGMNADTCSYVGTDGKDGTSVAIESVTKVDKTTTVVLTDSNGKTKTLSINDGVDGDNGNGVHIAWSNSADGKTDFTTNNKKTGADYQYIGVYTDDKDEDSTNYADYTWTKIKGEDGTSVTIKNIQYASGTSGTTAPTTGWQNTVPSVSAGKWLWCKTTYSDSNVSYTCSYMGTDGVDGKSVAVESVVKSGKTTTVKLKDSDGNETSFQINDGQDGTNGIGINGTNAYVHLAWANSADGKTDFSTTVSSGKSYMGVYTDSTEGDSTTYSDYTWTKIKGDDGLSPTATITKSGDTSTITITDKNGTTTQTVKDGTNGTPAYLHVKYSNDGGKTFTSNSGEDVGTYIGTCTNSDSDDPTTVSAYKWAQIKGDGIKVNKSGTTTTITITNADGTTSTQTIKDGTNGTSAYLHVKYSNDGGKTFTANNGETVGTYIGICTDSNSTDPTTVSSYSWAKIKGADGTSVTVKSIQYASGDSGTTAPTTGWQNTVPSVTQGKWLWCRTTYSNGSTADTCSYMGTDGDDGNSVAVESVTKSGKVTTVKLKDTAGKETSFQITDGTDGKDGIGIAGTNSYIHIAWSNSSDGKTDFSTTASSGKSYMGVYTDDKQADSSTYSDYTWTKIKGDTGATGATGAQGPQGENGVDLSNGKMLFTDPYFAFSNNNCNFYNNSNNGNVKIERVGISSDNPFSATSVTSYELKIVNTGTASPGCGGFDWDHGVRANAIFIYRIIAKIPTGRHLLFATNAIGNGPSTKWLTSNDGTGKFTEYIFKVICGSAGTFSSTGFFYIDGSIGTTDNPIEWRVAYATCFDMTSRSDVTTALSTAAGKNKTVYSENADPSATTGYVSGDTWFNKATGGIWQFDGKAWKLHQVGTVSISNGAVTADKIAAGSITAEKLSAKSVSLGNLDETLITSNLLPDSINNIDCWLPGMSGYNTMNSFLMEHTGDSDWYYDCNEHESSIDFIGVSGHWEWIYYKISGLNRNEYIDNTSRTYTLSFEFESLSKDITLHSGTYIPFGVFGYQAFDNSQGISNVSKDWNTGNLTTIQVNPSKGRKKYKVTFSTYYNSIYLAFNFGYIADQNEAPFSFGKFKLEVGSEDTPWVAPKGLYLDNNEMHINADSIVSGTINAVDILGSHISGGNIIGNTIEGNTISGGTVSGTNITGSTITGNTINGNTISGGTVSGTKITGGTISGTDITGSTIRTQYKNDLGWLGPTKWQKTTLGNNSGLRFDYRSSSSQPDINTSGTHYATLGYDGGKSVTVYAKDVNSNPYVGLVIHSGIIDEYLTDCVRIACTGWGTSCAFSGGHGTHFLVLVDNNFYTVWENSTNNIVVRHRVDNAPSVSSSSGSVTTDNIRFSRQPNDSRWLYVTKTNGVNSSITIIG